MQAEQEGVIKYRLEHTFSEPSLCPEFPLLRACRRALFKAGLIGQHPQRYDGLGYGNLSLRLTGPTHFLVSGTQTGEQPDPGMQSYAEVVDCDPRSGWLHSKGPVKPSSEALTHAQIYGLDTAIRSVVHVHSPELWHAAETLGLPSTPPDAAYGTLEMVLAVQALWDEGRLRSRPVFAMGGHQDGIISFGVNPEAASAPLFNLLQEI